MDRKINTKLGRTQVSNFDYSDETSNFPKVIKKTLSIDIALSIFPQKSLKTTYYYSILKIRMFPKTSFFLTKVCQNPFGNPNCLKIHVRGLKWV